MDVVKASDLDIRDKHLLAMITYDIWFMYAIQISVLKPIYKNGKCSG